MVHRSLPPPDDDTALQPRPAVNAVRTCHRNADVAVRGRICVGWGAPGRLIGVQYPTAPRSMFARAAYDIRSCGKTHD